MVQRLPATIPRCARAQGDGLRPVTRRSRYTDVTANTNYEMELDSYASCTFSHWQSSGSPTTDPLPFTQPNGPLTLVGVYNCTSGGAVGGGAPASMLALVFALLSQFAMPLGLLAAALGSFAVVRIKTIRGRPAKHLPRVSSEQNTYAA